MRYCKYSKLVFCVLAQTADSMFIRNIMFEMDKYIFQLGMKSSAVQTSFHCFHTYSIICNIPHSEEIVQIFTMKTAYIFSIINKYYKCKISQILYISTIFQLMLRSHQYFSDTWSACQFEYKPCKSEKPPTPAPNESTGQKVKLIYGNVFQ